MKVESPMTTPSSSMNGILPFGAACGPRRSRLKGRPAILSCTSVFMTNGLGSGRPKAGPKPNSVIMVENLPLIRRRAQDEAIRLVRARSPHPELVEGRRARDEGRRPFLTATLLTTYCQQRFGR